MLKKCMIMLLSASVTLVQAGGVWSCLKTTAETEIANGDAELMAKAVVAAALPKLLENGKVQKFEEKTKLKATQNSSGGYDFSLLGVPVASLAPQEDPGVVAQQLVPHIIAAHVAAASIQPSSTSAAASSSQS